MDEYGQQQSYKQDERRQKQGKRLAAASLILGLLSVIMSFLKAVPYVASVPAIVLGVLSLKRQGKGMAIAGIVTGAFGTLLFAVFLVLGTLNSILTDVSVMTDSGKVSRGANNPTSVSRNVTEPGGTTVESGTLRSAAGYENNTMSTGSVNDPINSGNRGNPTSVTSQTEDLKADLGDRMVAFYGNGYELMYSKLLWTPRQLEGYGESKEVLNYLLDETIMIPSGVSPMLGYSTGTEAGRKELYQVFQSMYKTAEEAGKSFLVSGTETFEVLKEDVYYASYCICDADDRLLSKAFVVASERDDAIVSFSVQVGDFVKLANLEGIDISVLPILRSITFTGNMNMAGFGENKAEETGDDEYFYEEKVERSEEEYIIGEYVIPSISKIMDDLDISHTVSAWEKTVGRMVIPRSYYILASSELVPVEIIEETYQEVEDVWQAIDVFGRVLFEEYGFLATVTPEEYPNYGEDYRFCELVKQMSDTEAGIGLVYVSAVYSRNEKEIKVQFGTIETSSPPQGMIGHIRLDKVAEKR